MTTSAACDKTEDTPLISKTHMLNASKRQIASVQRISVLPKKKKKTHFVTVTHMQSQKMAIEMLEEHRMLI
jgi:hypothetical protein